MLKSSWIFVVLHNAVHWGFYMFKVGWSQSILEGHTKATKPAMHSDSEFIAGWDLQGSETDWFDMGTIPVVFVSNQGSLIWDMTEASVFQPNRKCSAPHGGLSLCDATQHRQDVLFQWLHNTCTFGLSMCSLALKYAFHLFLMVVSMFGLMQLLNCSSFK